MDGYSPVGRPGRPASNGEKDPLGAPVLTWRSRSKACRRACIGVALGLAASAVLGVTLVLVGSGTPRVQRPSIKAVAGVLQPVTTVASPSSPAPADSSGPHARPPTSVASWARSVPEVPTALRVPILTYHVIAPWSVARVYSRPSLAIDPRVFDAQLGALRTAGWRTITVSQLADALASGVAPPPRTFVLTIDDGHSDGYTYALPALQRHGFVATFYVVAGRVGKPDNLTWEQIKALAAAGMEIGDHTLDHRPLAKLSSAEVQAQVELAQARFLAELGVAPTSFAYPFGSFDASVAAIVQAAGFHMAVTTEHGAAESWSARLVVPRLEVGPSFSPAQVLAEIGTYH